MCGRFSYAAPIHLLTDAFGLLDVLWDYPPRYNIAQGQLLMAITNEQGARQVNLWKWGLSSWAKEAKVSYATFNARAETVFTKPMFRGPIRRQRCLVPTDGFCEWKSSHEGKQPMRIVLPDRAVFAPLSRSDDAGLPRLHPGQCRAQRYSGVYKTGREYFSNR